MALIMPKIRRRPMLQRRTAQRALAALAGAVLWTAAQPSLSQDNAKATVAAAIPRQEALMTPIQAAQQRQKRLQDAGISDLTLVEALPFGPGGAERWRLANGLEVVIAADSHAPVVAVHTWVKVGSADESVGHTGLAHLFEHLMFKGTVRHPPGAFDRLLEQHGASANAATWLDWTMYHQVVPPAQLAQVLDLEADRLTNLQLTQAALRAELEVVRNERMEVVDNHPDGQMDEAVWLAVFGEGPYGHPTLGLASDLSRVTLTQARDFYRAYYAPGNTSLVLVGALDVDAALKAVVASHGGLPARASPQRAKAAPSKSKGDRKVEIDSASARLAMVWPTVALDDPDHPALAVLAEVLAGADSTRLHRALIDGKRLASHVSCDQTDLRLGGAFEVRVALRPGLTAPAVETEVHALVAQLLGAQPVTDAEVAGAKNRMKTDELRELASVDSRADLLGHTWATVGSLAGHAAWQQRLAQLQAADVQRAAQAWLKPGQLVIIHGEPRSAAVAPPRVSRKSAAGSLP